jgi:phosphohistidine phosphatase
MRRLLLLRHAKAERAQPGGRDQDRTLAARGQHDARKLGVYLARHGFIPDQAVVSTSARTRETWALVAAAFDKEPAAEYEDRIYEAAPEAILKVVQEANPRAKTVLLVGHNPGLQELAAMLIASGDVETRQRLKEEFPTSALAAIQFAVDDWHNVHLHGGRLEHFVTPDSLKAATD